MPTRYVHTNVVCEDWQALARYYQEIFDSMPVPPKRDLSGVDWRGELSQVVEAEIPGVGFLTFVYLTETKGNIIEI